MAEKLSKELVAFQRLLTIMDELREKCPWDRKQTIHTLRKLTIEETYELADAIIENDFEDIKNELGDLMLHIAFYTKIASEKNEFEMADVLNGVCEKLIHRHPHIYGDPENSGQVVKVDSDEEVKQNWEQLKLKEGKESVLEGVPNSLPAMVKANRIQEKVKAVGFDWEEPGQVWEKVQEELEELKKEVDLFNPSELRSSSFEEGDKEKIESELGDVFFSLINYARFLDVDPEAALEKTNKKFTKRFQYLEKEAKKIGKKLKEMTLQEMDEYWEAAKKK
ncbi:MAG: nucleoside triphosphate pyrophosphohydrolase [Flavobacteriales bacterium]|nr:nucleoside triphosphate pyrophosphohydrolase [Bacteroidales bacterium AH-315-I05]PCJ82163.1 MAG: nucleoside triphosphate pyrophosphohydrolase [Flavobacteriales bacterium]